MEKPKDSMTLNANGVSTRNAIPRVNTKNKRNYVEPEINMEGTSAFFNNKEPPNNNQENISGISKSKLEQHIPKSCPNLSASCLEHAQIMPKSADPSGQRE